VGRAATLLRRGSRGVQVTGLVGEVLFTELPRETV
jgi:hypothetical protein